MPRFDKRRRLLKTAGTTLVVGLLAGCSSEGGNGGPNNGGNPTNVELDSATLNKGSFNTSVTGHVVNTGSQVGYVSANVKFFDEDENVLDTGTAEETGGLKGGGTWQFTVVYDGDDRESIADGDAGFEVTLSTQQDSGE